MIFISGNGRSVSVSMQDIADTNTHPWFNNTRAARPPHELPYPFDVLQFAADGDELKFISRFIHGVPCPSLHLVPALAMPGKEKAKIVWYNDHARWITANMPYLFYFAGIENLLQKY